MAYCGGGLSFYEWIILALNKKDRSTLILTTYCFKVYFKKINHFPEFDEEEYSSEGDEEEEKQNLGDEVQSQISAENDQLMEGNSSLLAKSQPIRQLPVQGTLGSGIRI